MWAPGATRSGLTYPSCVTPRLDHGARLSSVVSLVPWSSTAPTVITYGSLAGAYDTASASVPRFPAAATTTNPCIQAASTAASNGSTRYDSGSVDPSDRLITRTP